VLLAVAAVRWHRGPWVHHPALVASASAPPLLRLVLVQGAGHGLDNPSQWPTPDQLTALVADFLTRTMGGS
jgi:hypothetical protein